MQYLPEAARQPAEAALIVSFRLGSQQYGLPVAAVREVVRLPALVTLAGVAPALCGLLNMRGLFVPVFDGRVLVGEPAMYDLNKQVVIVGRAQPELGIIVDLVQGVVQCASLNSASLPRPVAGALIESVWAADREPILGLRLAALLELAAEVTHAAPAPPSAGIPPASE